LRADSGPLAPSYATGAALTGMPTGGLSAAGSNLQDSHRPSTPDGAKVVVKRPHDALFEVPSNVKAKTSAHHGDGAADGTMRAPGARHRAGGNGSSRACMAAAA
jgi:hypothetical protein